MGPKLREAALLLRDIPTNGSYTRKCPKFLPGINWQVVSPYPWGRVLLYCLGWPQTHDPSAAEYWNFSCAPAGPLPKHLSYFRGAMGWVGKRLIHSGSSGGKSRKQLWRTDNTWTKKKYRDGAWSNPSCMSPSWHLEFVRRWREGTRGEFHMWKIKV
jgi:hypothetical protein